MLGEEECCPKYELPARQPLDSGTVWLAAFCFKKYETRFGVLNAT